MAAAAEGTSSAATAAEAVVADESNLPLEPVRAAAISDVRSWVTSKGPLWEVGLGDRVC